MQHKKELQWILIPTTVACHDQKDFLHILGSKIIF